MDVVIALGALLVIALIFMMALTVIMDLFGSIGWWIGYKIKMWWKITRVQRRKERESDS